MTGEGMDEFRQALVDHARKAMPKPGDLALNRRQRDLVGQAAIALQETGQQPDPLILAELLRQARLAFDSLLGRTATEDVLDTLFRRFCIGK
jgi:tRNA modification GTPase